MGKSKFGIFMMLGAVIGAIVSLFDRSTRDQVTRTSKNVLSDVRFYSKNPDILKQKAKQKTDKIQSMYEQFSGDAMYIKEKVEELKVLSPQVKDIVVDTKETFADSKGEYQTIVNENQTEPLGK